MASFLGAVISDLHFESLDKHWPDGDDLMLSELDKAYQFALKRGITHMFITGDIVNSTSPSYKTQRKLYEFFKKYDGVMNTIYIIGNHDYIEKGESAMSFLGLVSLDALQRLDIISDVAEWEVNGVPLCAVPYPYLESPTITHKRKTGSIIFSHWELNGVIGDNGRKVKSTNVPRYSKHDFVFNGHYHTHQTLGDNLVCVGNPYQRNFGETDQKGFVIFEATFDKVNGLQVEWNRVNNTPAFRLETLHITDPLDFDKLTNADNVRYKLMVDPLIVVDPEILVRYPITGGVWVGQKEADLTESEVVRSDVDITFGLQEHLESLGYENPRITWATNEVKRARDVLGID